MSIKPNRAPNTSWSMRRPGFYPNGYVTTLEDDLVQVAYFEGSGSSGQALVLSRREARMLARRINQCLDGTRS